MFTPLISVSYSLVHQSVFFRGPVPEISGIRFWLAGAIPGKTPDAFIRNAFVHVLARPAREEELAACREFWDRQMQELKDDKRVRESLVRVLFNHNDFVTIR